MFCSPHVCVNTFTQQFFAACGADAAGARPWLQLSDVTLVGNALSVLDDDVLALWPAVRTLDLSDNAIAAVSAGFKCVFSVFF